MRSSRVVALALLFVLGLTVIGRAEGTLSGEDWKKLQTDVDAALSGKDAAKLRAALVKLGEDQSVRALRLLLKVLAGWEHDLTPAAQTARVLARDPKVKKEILQDVVVTSRPPRARAALAAALSGDDQESFPVLLKLLNEDVEEVAIVAVQDLVAAGDPAVEPFLARMEKAEAAKGPVWEELRHALTGLLGMKLGSAAEFKGRWADLKERGGTAAAKGDAKEGKQATPAGPKTVDLFGREIACSRVVFILDVSGSMKAVDDPKLELPPEGNGTKGKEPAPSGGADPRSRIERAKRELVKVLKGLPRTTKTNLIAYSSGVRFWKPGPPLTLHALTDPVRQEAIEWVQQLTASGATATDDALDNAFDVEGARCFYLLSDGVPSKGRRERIPTDEILKLIEKKNAIKKIHIHTLGFVGADRDFMRAVARAGGGEYSDIK